MRFDAAFNGPVAGVSAVGVCIRVARPTHFPRAELVLIPFAVMGDCAGFEGQQLLPRFAHRAWDLCGKAWVLGLHP